MKGTEVMAFIPFVSGRCLLRGGSVWAFTQRQLGPPEKCCSPVPQDARRWVRGQSVIVRPGRKVLVRSGLGGVGVRNVVVRRGGWRAGWRFAGRAGRWPCGIGDGIGGIGRHTGLLR